MDENQIIHIDLDSFFVSVECRSNPCLLGKPVAIGGSSERGVVASCSYEARKYGVHSAMSGRLAKQLCPELLFIRGDYDSYSKASLEITEMINEAAPVFEKTSIDEFYMDMTGFDDFNGTLEYSKELRQRIIKETALPISFGMSKNKTVSKVATGLAKPNNYKYVNFGDEKSFLAPLSVRKLPMIGEKAGESLRKMGIKKVFTLQQMPLQLLQSAFGKHGTMMWEKANAIDNSSIIPYTERKSLSSEETFDKDTMDIGMLECLLVSMTEDLCFKMRNENFLTGCVSVKIRYSDFNTYTQQIKISYSSSDHELIPQVKMLFKKLYNRRMLIRLIGVRLSKLVRGHQQIHLFNDNENHIQLYQALDNINNRFGNKSVHRAVTMGINSRSFNPFNGISS
ncbi:DNA polymerase IV [Pedobacter psychrophilus]|uniref:DNA polymerase IV n=1 Tax=Pedobacter psychrophilus TaxID=1826909 RepID=A0A179DER6_9SPHI|nr:DNA polymerase IV [Pedobacter psychrophilus]OAQ39521.1 DNA polymerase IV [Pedobacter psychrophilus]